jgi:hypothetical protein
MDRIHVRTVQLDGENWPSEVNITHIILRRIEE